MEYILLFLEGMITFVSPCILPMLPLYIAYFSGESGEGNRGRVGMLINLFGFIMGFTIVFTLIGTMAGTLGAWLNHYQKLVNLFSGAVVTVFGLNYAGILKIRFMERSYRMNVEIQSFQFFSSALFGIVFAVGWTPCVGTFLGSALMIAMQAGNSVKGAGMLFIYSIGLAVPFVLCGMFLDALKGTVSFFKQHFNVMNKIFGSILILLGISMMTGTFYKMLLSLMRSGVR